MATTLAGKTVVFTGALESFAPFQAPKDWRRSKLDYFEWRCRAHAAAVAAVQQAGARVEDRVGATTDFLVVGVDAGSKEVAAKARGIRIVREPEFIAMLTEAA